jgi:hypothetical protein
LTCYTLGFDGVPLADNRMLEIFLDLFQVVDIILMFITTRVDPAGQEVDLIGLIAKDYVRETFVFDAIGCFPGLIAGEQVKGIYFLKVLRFIQVTRTIEQVDYIVTKAKQKYL